MAALGCVAGYPCDNGCASRVNAYSWMAAGEKADIAALQKHQDQLQTPVGVLLDSGAPTGRWNLAWHQGRPTPLLIEECGCRPVGPQRIRMIPPSLPFRLLVAEAGGVHSVVLQLCGLRWCKQDCYLQFSGQIMLTTPGGQFPHFMTSLAGVGG